MSDNTGEATTSLAEVELLVGSSSPPAPPPPAGGGGPPASGGAGGGSPAAQPVVRITRRTLTVNAGA